MHARFKLLVALFALGAAPALAATATANLSVTATVQDTCTVTTTDVAFGIYNPSSGSPDDDGVGAVKVRCTSGTTYTIALDDGANPATPGDNTSRRMNDGGSNYLPYALYLEAGRTTIWGDGSSGSLSPASGSNAGDGTEQSYGVYGRIGAGQYVAPGSYTDTVVVTVTYPIP